MACVGTSLLVIIGGQTLVLLLSPWEMFVLGSCSPVDACYRLYVVAVIACYSRGSDPVATAIAVGYVRTGVMFARTRCDRLLLRGVAAVVQYVAAALPPGLRPAGRTNTIVGCARTYTMLSLCRCREYIPVPTIVPNDAVFLSYGVYPSGVTFLLIQRKVTILN